VHLVAAELPTVAAGAAIAALALAAVLAVWLIPREQRRRWEDAGLEGKDLAELENGSRSTLVQLFGGVALILTFVVTWLQIADTRKATDRTLQLTAAQQETERFTRAVEQLGSTRQEVRIGGIYGLQQAARDTPNRGEAVAHLMVAYLKSHHRLRVNDTRLKGLDTRNELAQQGTAVVGPCESSAAPPWPDTQAALSVLLGIPSAARPRMDLIAVDLIGVRINGADFSGAMLTDASLAGAKLAGARFDDALLSRTDLRRACLRQARFDHADVGFVDATGADFSGADLSTADLPGGTLPAAVTDECTRLPNASPVPEHCDLP
jgi:uncharacterized protein YjbI with pentapeptide repeats